VKPNVLIPIHGGKLHLHKHAEIAWEYGIKNVIVPSDGDVIRLSEQKPEVVEKFCTKTLAVDGSKLLPLDGAVYRQREFLSNGGVVSACVRFSKGFVKLENMVCLGIFEESEQIEMTDICNDISSEIKLSLERISNDKLRDIQKIKSLVEKLIKTIFMDARGKRPVVIVHIIQ
jgi:ribonuclease J